ncbi:hypothetical protein HHK36_007327 [Tetracentron sinense]|uniref:Plant intracellular Ras-group-related LRR protein 7 n=1 Tax=Tetracentron sinense TaxID=13715 RepID=A0A834ZIQ5_TETSI|nr:hypothetical protein HHK36_007327 [Tetracentron sinense]
MITTVSSQLTYAVDHDSVFSTTLPNEVLDLDRSVRTLDLTHNKVVDIPMDISKLINMQRLILADNLIERLPMNLGKLQSLKVLTLDGNQITTLPDELGLLVRLERLSISGNLLTWLPETIGSLRNAVNDRMLEMLCSLACDVTLQDSNEDYLTMQLLLLNVSNNKLKSLPESIGSCFSMEELQANGNSIEDLPPSVCNLIHLKSLCLDNNNVHQMEGFQEFEARRKKKFDKQIDSNVMIGSKGLDEGVDL